MNLPFSFIKQYGFDLSFNLFVKENEETKRLNAAQLEKRERKGEKNAEDIKEAAHNEKSEACYSLLMLSLTTSSQAGFTKASQDVYLGAP